MTDIMVRRRPSAILAMAIVNFVFGGLGILAVLCMGSTLALSMFIPETLPGQQTIFPNEHKYVAKELPGFTAYVIITLVLGLIGATVLIIASIGLLRLRNWARRTCVIYAVISIVFLLPNTYYTLAYVNPLKARFAEELQPTLPPGTPNVAGFSVLNDVVAIAAAVIGIGYAVALLIVMFLPSVSAAFSGQGNQVVEPAKDPLRR